MAGYTYKWKCRICKDCQETVNSPKLRICDKCLANLAEALCNQKLMHSINDPGIDKQHWMNEAKRLAEQLFRLWKPIYNGEKRV